MAKQKGRSDKRNSEGYLDLTAFLALRNIEREERHLSIAVTPSHKRRSPKKKAKGKNK